MRFSILFVSVCVSIGLSQAALDHLPDAQKFNHLTGDKVGIDRGHTAAYKKRKRDYATTLELLKAAVASYQQPAQELAPPPPVEEAIPPPVEEVVAPVQEVLAPPPTEEKTLPPPPTQEVVAPPPPAEEQPTEPAPLKPDIEEDDKFDPEEDPDDVDDPPMINGVPTQREE